MNWSSKKSLLVIPSLTLAALAVASTPRSALAAELPEELRGACEKRIPSELWTDPAALEGAGANGSWSIAVGSMDGQGPDEAFVIMARNNRPVEIRFIGAKESGDIADKKVKLKRPTAYASVSFESVTDGVALAHVDGGEGGQVLLSWNGDKLDTVWKATPDLSGARFWFELEDLNDDGTAEVVTYMQRELDVFLNEDDLEDSSSGVGTASVDVQDVYQLNDGRWKKSKDLRAGLR